MLVAVIVRPAGEVRCATIAATALRGGGMVADLGKCKGRACYGAPRDLAAQGIDTALGTTTLAA